jgi:glycosyltransferase involved in cell wall biosynthesis
VTRKADLVSVLIPAYNVAPFVGATIQSALCQTWPRVEVIVVDDGSTDNTLSVARAFANRVAHVVTQPNSGAPAARNRALSLAQGQYIQWLDADDLLHPDKVGAQMRVACELGNSSVVLSGAFGTFYHRPTKAAFTPTALWRDLDPVDYFLARFTKDVYFQTDAWLVSRELTEAAGPWTDFNSPDDDGEYFSRVVMKSAGVKFVENARSFYRIANLNGVSRGRSARSQTALYESKAKCINYLLSLEDSDRTRAACVQLLQDWLFEFYPYRDDLVRRARELAVELGGELHEPVLKWKYQPVKWLFGYRAASRANSMLPQLRARVVREWDKAMYRLTMESDRHQAE